MVAFGGVGFGLFLFVRRLIVGAEVEGVFTLFAILFTLLGIAMAGLGLVGEYVGRIYQQVRGRPTFRVRRIYGLGEEALGRLSTLDPRLSTVSMTRIAVFAYSDTGHACLKLLLERRERIVFVGTHRDNPDEAQWYPSVAKLAKAHGIEPVILENPLDPQAVARMRILAPDLILSFYYRRILPDEMLAVPRLGAYNMHGSLLPKFRGRAPVNWAVLKGETRTGATLHLMTGRADAGGIVDQEAVPIGPDDTALEVQKRVTEAAAVVLARRIEELKAGAAQATPQDESKASRFGKRRPEDGRIDFIRPAKEVHDLVRAVTHPVSGRLH